MLILCYFFPISIVDRLNIHLQLLRYERRSVVIFQVTSRTMSLTLS